MSKRIFLYYLYRKLDTYHMEECKLWEYKLKQITP